MEKVLLEFVETLDSSLKRLQEEIGDRIGFSSLTVNQFHYIDAIYELQEPTITEIAERMHITKASVTTGINKLLKSGYITKTQSNRDRRVYHVKLTAKGSKLIHAKYLALQEYGKFIEKALSNDEAEQLEAILTKLVALFKQG